MSEHHTSDVESGQLKLPADLPQVPRSNSWRRNLADQLAASQPGLNSPETRLHAASEAAAALVDKMLCGNDITEPMPLAPGLSKTGAYNRQPSSCLASPPVTGNSPSREMGGVDTLVLRLRGEWDRSRQDVFFADLEAVRREAEKVHQELPFVFPTGDDATVRPFGFNVTYEGRYPWVLVMQGTSIGFADRRGQVVREENRKPDVVVRLSSVMLMEFGLAGAWRLVRELLASVGFIVDEYHADISEWHGCVDMLFKSSEIVDNVVSHCFVSQCRDARPISRDREWVGFEAGRRGAMMVVAYDKLQELEDRASPEAAKKTEVMERYRFAGEIPKFCTRIEFRLWRDALRERGIKTLADLFKAQGWLVRYLTQAWFRVTGEVDRDNGNQSRAKASPRWAEVCQAFESWAGRELVERRAAVRTTLDAAKLIKIVEGLTCSVVASSKDGATALAAWFREQASLIEADAAAVAPLTEAEFRAAWLACRTCEERAELEARTQSVRHFRDGPYVQGCVSVVGERRLKVERRLARYRARIGDFQWSQTEGVGWQGSETNDGSQ